MTGKTLYARLPAWLCVGVLCAVVVMTILSARPHAPLYIRALQPSYQNAKITDSKLYKAILTDVETGENYYTAAPREHRVRYYPTSPPQVFREPTLAYFLAALRFQAVQIVALFGLYAALVVLFYRELLANGTPFWGRVGALTIAITGPSVVGVTDGVYWHEIWAALLLALSLFSYGKASLWLTVTFALLACLIRELAAPYFLVMLLFAICQRRWKEVAAWVAVTALFVSIFALHLARAGQLHKPGDLVSEGWLGLAGWDFSIATARWNFSLYYLPDPLVALAIFLGVIGLAGCRDGRAQRAALLVAGYVTAFLVVGRPDNYYWGILYAPFLSVGFLFAPTAIVDLCNRGFSLSKGAPLDGAVRAAHDQSC